MSKNPMKNITPKQCIKCGNDIPIRGYHLSRPDHYYKHTSYCSRGCSRKLPSKKDNLRMWRVWAAMRQRCNNPNNQSYASYGGRGIKVCKRWDSFELFYKDFFIGYKDGLSLDRIDVNGNYEPRNCRWATNAEQARNTTRNKWITYDGRTQVLFDWLKEMGIAPAKYYSRMQKLGWTQLEALNMEKRR